MFLKLYAKFCSLESKYNNKISSPLPLRTYTARSVTHQIIGLTGRNPVDINVMNDHNAIVQMEPEVVVVPVAQDLHAKHK